jgi:hypothetical protein
MDIEAIRAVRAVVKTISWKTVPHPEVTIWVKCSQGGEAWTLGMEVLPTLEVRPPTMEVRAARAAPGSDIHLAAKAAVVNYLARNRTGIKEIFSQTRH